MCIKWCTESGAHFVVSNWFLRQMPRYDESPSHRGGHSPLERRDRRLKSPLNDRRRRDSPLSMRPLSSRDSYEDSYRMKDHSSHHRSADNNNSSSSMPYKILCVSNLNHKTADSVVHDTLLREFQRFGEPNVKLVYDSNVRLAYLYFRSYEDARDARHAKSRLLLFDKTISIEPMYERQMQLPRRRSISPDYGSRNSSMRRAPPSPPMQRRPPPPPMRNNMNDKMYMQVIIVFCNRISCRPKILWWRQLIFFLPDFFSDPWKP